MGWCLGETHTTHPIYVAGKKCQSSTQVIFKKINSYSSTVLIHCYFQSYLLCIADRGGESIKCVGAHLP